MSNKSAAHTATVDGLYLSTILKRVRNELSRAQLSFQFERADIESLRTQQALPPPYRQIYGQIADSLLRIEQIIEETHGACREWEKARCLFRNLDKDSPNPDPEPLDSPEIVSAARQAIDEINAAEVRLVGHCESEKATLLTHDKSGLVDWSNCVGYDFSMLLDPGPERAFYKTCCAGDEPLWIPLGAYSADFLYEDSKICNWNSFKFDQNHPLQSGHHGYLVHCITDHLHIPWQLISCIKEIQVGLEFTACKTVWERASAPRSEANKK